jgi:hypothetical protein
MNRCVRRQLPTGKPGATFTGLWSALKRSNDGGRLPEVWRDGRDKGPVLA